jgi:hypothetical protein
MNLRFIQDNLYPLFGALTLVAAAVCWFGTTVPVHPLPGPLAAEPWQLPQLAEHNSPRAITTINARNLWGDAAATAAAAKPPEWRVVGITTQGTNHLVLVAFEGQPLTLLKVGDTLPDDSKIVQIEKDRFFVMTKDKKKLPYGLHKNDQVK